MLSFWVSLSIYVLLFAHETYIAHVHWKQPMHSVPHIAAGKAFIGRVRLDCIKSNKHHRIKLLFRRLKVYAYYRMLFEECNP
jgi:hypothetical protein